MRIPVHSPWLPGYIDVAQTVLVILTMGGLFPDRPLNSIKFLLLTIEYGSIPLVLRRYF